MYTHVHVCVHVYVPVLVSKVHVHVHEGLRVVFSFFDVFLQFCVTKCIVGDEKLHVAIL